MEPAGLIAKHQPPINQRRRAPDRGPCAISPNDLALVRGQAIEITIARTDMHSSVRDNRACPKATLLFACAAFRFIFPNKLAIRLAEAIDIAVLRRGVNETVTDGRSGIGIGADARLPNSRAVREI